METLHRISRSSEFSLVIKDLGMQRYSVAGIIHFFRLHGLRITEGQVHYHLAVGETQVRLSDQRNDATNAVTKVRRFYRAATA